MPDLSTVGARIRAARKRKNMTDTRLAEVSGIHITTIRRYERDKVKVGEVNAPKLSKALDMDLADLL